MKCIIAGSRGYNDESDFTFRLDNIITHFGTITEVVCGGAKGPDSLGRAWALLHGISVADFPAEWTKFGRAAGYIRNAEMAKYADGCILFWDGYSKGTANMLDLAKKHNLKLHVELV